MNDQDIINNAPAGWTHYIESTGEYLVKLNKHKGFETLQQRWRPKKTCSAEIRARIDIESVAELNKRIDELESELRHLNERHLNLALYHGFDPQQAKAYGSQVAKEHASHNKVKGMQECLRLCGSQRNDGQWYVTENDIHSAIREEKARNAP